MTGSWFPSRFEILRDSCESPTSRAWCGPTPVITQASPGGTGPGASALTSSRGCLPWWVLPPAAQPLLQENQNTAGQREKLPSLPAPETLSHFSICDTSRLYPHVRCRVTVTRAHTEACSAISTDHYSARSSPRCYTTFLFIIGNDWLVFPGIDAP